MSLEANGPDGSGPHHRPDIIVDVQRGAPTEEELAALIAVVTEAYDDEAARATADDSVVRSAWSLSQRSLRQPLRRDIGWARG